MVIYNPWPIGNVPDYLRRPELEILKTKGYVFNDPRDVVDLFEQKVKDFTGSRYALAVDCCTHALELCLRYKIAIGEIDYGSSIGIPENTYISVPMTITKLGLRYKLMPTKWSGIYPLICSGLEVIDAAVRWQEGMYLDHSLMCLSFQIKKRIPIGRGGMILLDNLKAYEAIKLMRYDGRDLDTAYDSNDHIKSFGYHYYMTPEDAARGILLMDEIKEQGDSASYLNYPNLNKWLKH